MTNSMKLKNPLKSKSIKMHYNAKIKTLITILADSQEKRNSFNSLFKICKLALMIRACGKDCCTVQKSLLP